MLNLDSINVSIAQMRYFTVVVEANSFTRAARLLNMTQSAISKNIASLEDLLGFQLFIRDKKRLILTEAGKFLYKEWVSVLSSVDKSIDDARALQGGHADTLYVGILSTHIPSIYLYPIIDIFKVINPKVRVYVEECASEDVRKKLVNGEFDIAFNVLYDLEELGAEGFSTKIIKECPLSAGMLKSSPLAKKEEVTIEELAEYNFVSISARFTQSYYNMIKSLFSGRALTPGITLYVNTAYSQLLNLRTPNDYFIMDRFYTNYGDPYFAWRPIKDTRSGVFAAWNPDNKKKGLLDFIDAMDEFKSIESIFDPKEKLIIT